MGRINLNGTLVEGDEARKSNEGTGEFYLELAGGGGPVSSWIENTDLGDLN